MDDRPKVDDRAPADAIDGMVQEVLRLAETWTAWDGKPIPIPSGQRVYTPHKAIRRVADHMIDHLAQLQAELARAESIPDRWQASRITTPADMAPFTREDLDEARSRLERLALMWRTSLASIPPNELDASDGEDYSPRELAFHTLESIDYANYLGDLSETRGPT